MLNYDNAISASLVDHGRTPARFALSTRRMLRITKPTAEVIEILTSVKTQGYTFIVPARWVFPLLLECCPIPICTAVKPRVETAADRSFGREAVEVSRLQDTASYTSWVVIKFAVRPHIPLKGTVAVIDGLLGFLRPIGQEGRAFEMSRAGRIAPPQTWCRSVLAQDKGQSQDDVHHMLVHASIERIAASYPGCAVTSKVPGAGVLIDLRCVHVHSLVRTLQHLSGSAPSAERKTKAT